MRNRSENQITLVLIRHGATQSNKEHRYLGRTEEALAEEGIRELLKYREERRYPKVTYLFSSPMKRCLETAEIIYPDMQPIIIPEWKEMDFGAFEGKNYRELEGDRRYQEWIDSNGTLPFPDGESREAFMLRCDKGFGRMREQLLALTAQNEEEQLLALTAQNEEEQPLALNAQNGEEQLLALTAQNGEEPKTAGLVVHGGTIMALLSRYCGGEYFDYQVPNGGGYMWVMDKVSVPARL